MRFKLHTLLLLAILQTASCDFNLRKTTKQESSSDPLLSLLLGFIFVFVTIPFLWYNERRSAINDYRLKTMKNLCQTISPYEIDPAANMKLVHLSWNAQTQHLLVDDQIGIQIANSIRLRRHTEMFQWVQHKLVKEKRTHYYFREEWSDTMHHANDLLFHNDFSKWTFKNANFINPQVSLGAYELSESLKLNAKNERKLELSDEIIQMATFQMQRFPQLHSHIKVMENTFYLHQSLNCTSIGDLRIWYTFVPCSQTTIVSQLINNSFQPYRIHDENDDIEDILSQQGEKDKVMLPEYRERGCCTCLMLKPLHKIDWIFDKNWTKDQCFSLMQEESDTDTFCGRFWGFLALWLGLILIFSPITIILLLFPLIGEFLAAITWLVFGIIAFFIAAALFCLTVSLAWIYYHPLKGVTLLLSSACVTYCIYYFAQAQLERDNQKL